MTFSWFKATKKPIEDSKGSDPQMQSDASKIDQSSLMKRLEGQDSVSSHSEDLDVRRIENEGSDTKCFPKKQVIKKYGLLHGLFQPLGIALAMLIGVYASISILSNYWHGYKRDLAYSKTRHIDKTAVEIFQSSLISRDRVELIIRNYDGELEKRLASNAQLKVYIKKRARELDAARETSTAELKAEMEALFATAFSDRDKVIDAYADWFFEWKRPYVILKEAISATTTRLIKLGEYESLRTAVERDMTDYFMRHYKEQVLKPEQRDDVLVAGIEKLVRASHQRYLKQMAHQDAEMREFLAQNTTYLDALPKGQDLTKTHLDWDAQRWRAPTFLMEDRAFDGIAGVGRVAVGGTIGALAIGPAVNKGLGGVFSSLSTRFASSMGARITLAEGGAVAGTVVEPVGGTFVGAAIGIVLGFAADYVANKLNEKFSRDKFIEANKEALGSTITLWRSKLEDNLTTSYDRWYNDAKAGLVIVRDKSDQGPVDEKSGEKKDEMVVF